MLQKLLFTWFSITCVRETVVYWVFYLKKMLEKLLLTGFSINNVAGNDVVSATLEETNRK